MTPETAPVPLPSLGRAGFGGALAVFAAVVGVGLGFNWITGDAPSAAIEGPGAAVAVAAAVFLLLRRPLMPLFAVLACAAVTAIGGAQSANPGWFAILLVVAWCTLIAGRRVGLPLWTAVMALFTVEWSAIRHDGGWGAWLAGSTCVFLAGLLLRNQFDLVARLRAAQAGLAAKARAEERNRIARDVHDVIAHSLTVPLLHVMSARLAVESDPADAARALAEAERLGRESLAEVRQVVGLLRTDSSADTGTGTGTGTDADLDDGAGADLDHGADADPDYGADADLGHGVGVIWVTARTRARITGRTAGGPPCCGLICPVPPRRSPV
jgi:signal transduction histidine kinase